MKTIPCDLCGNRGAKKEGYCNNCRRKPGLKDSFTASDVARKLVMDRIIPEEGLKAVLDLQPEAYGRET